jgi:hypothetical protein
MLNRTTSETRPYPGSLAVIVPLPWSSYILWRGQSAKSALSPDLRKGFIFAKPSPVGRGCPRYEGG